MPRPSLLRLSAFPLAAPAPRALASIPNPYMPDFEEATRRRRQRTGAEERQEAERADWDQKIMDRLKEMGHPAQIRGPAPAPPTFKEESWVPEANISPIPEENALVFKVKYYLQASGMQVAGHQRVHLTVKCRQLGLSEDELDRLAAIAGPRYNRSRGELKLVCGKHEQHHKNKAELRALLSRLLDDARQHAEVHKSIPQNRLPLHARKLPHVKPHGRKASHGPPLWASENIAE